MKSSLQIGLSQSDWAVLKMQRGSRATVIGSSEKVQTGPAEDLVDRLQSFLKASSAKNAANIIVADDQARLWLVTPPVNAGSPQDCRAAVEMRFQSLYGESSDGWRIEAEWNACHPFLACAIRHELLASLEKMANECELKLVSVMPQFIAAWNRWCRALKPGAWFGQIHGDGMMLAAMVDGKLQAVRAIAIPADARSNQSWLADVLEREALKLNMPMLDRFQFCGELPGGSTRHPVKTLGCERLDAPLEIDQASRIRPIIGDVITGERVTSPGMTLAATGIRW